MERFLISSISPFTQTTRPQMTLPSSSFDLFGVRLHRRRPRWGPPRRRHGCERMVTPPRLFLIACLPEPLIIARRPKGPRQAFPTRTEGLSRMSQLAPKLNLEHERQRV